MSDELIEVSTIIRPDGERVEVPLMGERFNHIDRGKDIIPTLRFQVMNGWKILEVLVPIILYYRPFCIVEIGAGASTVYFARFAEEFGVKLYSCDKSPRKNIEYFKDHTFDQRFSIDFMKDFDDTPAIVLIDADHHYEIAKQEFDFFFEKLVPGGVIFIHDTMAPGEAYLTEAGCGDVYLLRQELEQRQDLDCFTWPYTAGFMGLTMITKKYPDARYWEE